MTKRRWAIERQLVLSDFKPDIPADTDQAYHRDGLARPNRADIRRS